MNMVIACMTYSDQKLLPILLSLHGRKTNAHEISELSGMPYSTIKRRLDLMKRTGIIRIHGVGRRWGFIVEVINVQTDD